MLLDLVTLTNGIPANPLNTSVKKISTEIDSDFPYIISQGFHAGTIDLGKWKYTLDAYVGVGINSVGLYGVEYKDTGNLGKFLVAAKTVPSNSEWGTITAGEFRIGDDVKRISSTELNGSTYMWFNGSDKFRFKGVDIELAEGNYVWVGDTPPSSAGQGDGCGFSADGMVGSSSNIPKFILFADDIDDSFWGGLKGELRIGDLVTKDGVDPLNASYSDNLLHFKPGYFNIRIDGKDLTIASDTNIENSGIVFFDSLGIGGAAWIKQYNASTTLADDVIVPSVKETNYMIYAASTFLGDFTDVASALSDSTVNLSLRGSWFTTSEEETYILNDDYPDSLNTSRITLVKAKGEDSVKYTDTDLSSASWLIASSTTLPSDWDIVVPSFSRMYNEILTYSTKFIGNYTNLTTALDDPIVQDSNKGDWFTTDTPGTYFVTNANPELSTDVELVKASIDSSSFLKTGVDFDYGNAILSNVQNLEVSTTENLTIDSYIQSSWYTNAKTATLISSSSSEDAGDSSYREALAVEFKDYDTGGTGTTQARFAHGIRVGVYGTTNGTKDYHGIAVSAECTTPSTCTDRGAMAIGGDSTQYGYGVATNEFAARNPSGYAAKQLAAVMGVLEPNIIDDSPGTYDYNSFTALNNGTKRATNVLLGVGSFRNGIDLSGTTILTAGIVMPIGSQGSIITYSAGNYTNYDGNFNFILGGTNRLAISGTELLSNTSGLSLTGTQSTKYLKFNSTSSIGYEETYEYTWITTNDTNIAKFYADHLDINHHYINHCIALYSATDMAINAGDGYSVNLGNSISTYINIVPNSTGSINIGDANSSIGLFGRSPQTIRSLSDTSRAIYNYVVNSSSSIYELSYDIQKLAYNLNNIMEMLYYYGLSSNYPYLYDQ